MFMTEMKGMTLFSGPHLYRPRPTANYIDNKKAVFCVNGSACAVKVLGEQ